MPVLNIIVFNLPLYYVFHKLLNYDVTSTILTQGEYSIIYKKNSTSFRLRTLFLYFVSMIPFITLFSAVFYIIYIGNSYFIALEKVRKKEISNDEESQVLLK